MDVRMVDRVAMALSGRASRRSGLWGAVAAAFAGSRSGHGAAGPAPGAQGPCGDGSAADNRCRRNRDCCTAICKRKDGRGRCRCRKAGADCTQDRNCCPIEGAAARCVGGVCAAGVPPCTPLQGECAGDADCCAGVCGVVAAVERCCIPAGATGCVVNEDCCNPVGHFHCLAGACVSSASDARLKERVEPLRGNLAAALALRPVRWLWTGESGLGDAPQIGFIAQEVREVVPEVALEIGGGWLGIDYPKLAAVLAGAVQEQQAEIAGLRERLSALEAVAAGACPPEPGPVPSSHAAARV